MLSSKCRKIISLLSTAVMLSSNTAMLPANASVKEAEPHEVHSSTCDHEHDETGHGVKIALLDTGTTNTTTYKSVSFVNDDTIDSDHGNKMLGILNDKVPEANILDVRVLDDNGTGTYSDVSKGIKWAVDNDADIIVMSFAGYKNSSLLCDAIEYAENHNVFVVASAGNTYGEKAVFPAAFDTVVSVGATDENGSIMDYSNYGDYVDMYEVSSDGTSSAAQFVAASAAQLIEAEQDISVAELRKEFQWNEKPHITKTEEENSEELVYAACNHDYEKWRVTRNATCAKEGLKARTCKKYGCHYQQTQTIPKTAHTYAWKSGRAPTCTAAGTEEYRCTKCSHVSKTRSVASRGHDFENWRVTTKASCTSAGTKVRTCRRYGCHKEEKATIPITHEYDSWKVTKKATCTKKGTKTRICKKYGCKHTETQDIPKIAHSYSWEYDYPTSCTLDGIKRYKCKGCDHVKDTKPLKAPGHDFDKWRVSQAATCSKKGVKTRICKKCHKEEKKEIDKKDHSYSWVTTDPTCTADGYKKKTCKNCKHVADTQKLPKLGHSYGKWESIIPATCEKDGSKTRTCTRTGCRKQEKEVLKATGHKWQYKTTQKANEYSNGTEQQFCSVCSKKGQIKQTPAVDFSVAPNGNSLPFMFDYNGEAVARGFGIDNVTKYKGSSVFVIEFKANYNWSIDAPSFVNVHDKSTGNAIKNGSANKKYTLYVWLNKNNLEKTARGKRTSIGMQLLTFKVENANIPLYFKHSFTINSKDESVYYNKELNNTVDNLRNRKASNDLIDYLYGNKLTNKTIKVFKYDQTKSIAISSYFSNQDNLNIDYLIFETSSEKNKNSDYSQLDIKLTIYDVQGMKIIQDGSKPLITTQNTINQSFVNITDAEYEEALKKANTRKENIKLLKNIGFKFDFSKKIKNEIINTTIGELSNTGIDHIIDTFHQLDFDTFHENNGQKAKMTDLTLSLYDNCEINEKNKDSFIGVTCYGYNKNVVNKATINFVIVDSNGNKLPYSWSSN